MQTTVDLLILGAGWSSTFLIPLCDERGISYAATSRTGRDSTIQFVFSPFSEALEPYTALPNARTVLITFPIDKPGASERLVRLYTKSRTQEDADGGVKTRFIQLGTTSMWGGTSYNPHANILVPQTHNEWFDRSSVYSSTPRAEAEDELLELSPSHPTTVLNLSGLWGGERSAKNWVGRLTPSKEALKNKGSLHVIHGTDVARSILAVHAEFEKAQGQRWLLTDGRVYDWWDLASAWGSSPPPKSILDGTEQPNPKASGDADRGPQASWVRELMEESGVRALPRNVELLGRALDSRDFWQTFAISPIRARMEE